MASVTLIGWETGGGGFTGFYRVFFSFFLARRQIAADTHAQTFLFCFFIAEFRSPARRRLLPFGGLASIYGRLPWVSSIFSPSIPSCAGS